MEHGIDARTSRETVDRRLGRLAAGRHGVITRAEAFAVGAGRGLIEQRIATGRWEKLHPTVYRLAGAPSTWKQNLVAACLACGEGAAASHRSAGALVRLAGVEPGILETSMPWRRRVTVRGVIVHRVVRLEAVDITSIDHIPATTATRTLIDLAAVVSANVLEEALDDALRRRITSLSRLRWRIRELGARGRRGLGTLEALMRARVGRDAVPESVLETRLLRLIRKARLPLPVCQHKVKENGRLVAVVDFAYPDVRLAIEADGYRWHSGRARWDRDLSRRNRLTMLGWRVIHVTSHDLQREPNTIVAAISRTLAGV